MHNTPVFKGVKAPSNLRHRYIFEDIPAGLAPFVSLGETLGVSTPCMKTLIDLASIMLEADFWEQGRTVERLGIDDLNVEEINKLVLGN